MQVIGDEPGHARSRGHENRYQDCLDHDATPPEQAGVTN
jgi:hypothetical protein